ncbi:phosphatase PAP2 family protein [Gemmatimonas aurantiaca]|nr:phosphatase PAP2 family protein [Gemmatimonas aurantiaca]
METIFTADSALFVTINQTLANPVTDLLMPWITNDIVLRVLLVGIVAVLLIRGPARLRWLALGAIVAVGIADQLSSAVLKPLIGRLRPCHNPMFTDALNLLVHCGAGKSFPSSHAANSFAVVSFFAFAPLYNSQQSQKYIIRILLLAIATIVALSRVFVGVHFPADILVGAGLGATIGLALALGFRRLSGILSGL